MMNQELKLKAKTLELFYKLPRHVKSSEITAATGLTNSWLCDFTRGRIKSPNVDYVEKLYIFLAKKPLDL